jgi:hypothetical protein
MNPGAGVTSLSVLHDWYAALTEFQEEAQNALISLNLSLQRAGDWLGEQQQHWKWQIRLCEEEVTQAKAELISRQYIDFSGNHPDTTVQEENLRLARARLQFAEERLDAVRRWTKQLPLEIRDTYDGPARHLSFFLDGDLARGLALLTRQLTALEQYVNLQSAAGAGGSPAVASPPGPADATGSPATSAAPAAPNPPKEKP